MTRRTRGSVCKLVCHREGRSPVAISWYNVLDSTQYQEIATPLRARNDRDGQQPVLLLCPFFSYSCSMSCCNVMPSKKSSIMLPSLVHMARLGQLRAQAASQATGLKSPSVSRRIPPTV